MEVVTLTTVHCRSPNMNINGLSDLAWKEVVFPANNFNAGPMDGVVCVLSVFGHSRLQITRLYRFPVFIEPGAQFSCRFTDLNCITILTLDIVNDPTFLSIRDLILWSHQALAEGAMCLKEYLLLKYVPTDESSFFHAYILFFSSAAQ